MNSAKDLNTKKKTTTKVFITLLTMLLLVLFSAEIFALNQMPNDVFILGVLAGAGVICVCLLLIELFKFEKIREEDEIQIHADLFNSLKIMQENQKKNYVDFNKSVERIIRANEEILNASVEAIFKVEKGVGKKIISENRESAEMTTRLNRENAEAIINTNIDLKENIMETKKNIEEFLGENRSKLEEIKNNIENFQNFDQKLSEGLESLSEQKTKEMDAVKDILDAVEKKISGLEENINNGGSGELEKNIIEALDEVKSTTASFIEENKKMMDDLISSVTAMKSVGDDGDNFNEIKTVIDNLGQKIENLKADNSESIIQLSNNINDKFQTFVDKLTEIEKKVERLEGKSEDNDGLYLLINQEDRSEDAMIVGAPTESSILENQTMEEIPVTEEDTQVMEDILGDEEEATIEEVPVVEEVSSVEEVPITEEDVQVMEETLEVEEASATEEMPATEEAPVAEETSEMEEAPVAEEIPVTEEMPEMEESPVAEEMSVMEESP
ncbi:hypothetical protein SAMN04487761_14821, partial [Lachnospiraceae bacterium C7]